MRVQTVLNCVLSAFALHLRKCSEHTSGHLLFPSVCWFLLILSGFFRHYGKREKICPQCTVNFIHMLVVLTTVRNHLMPSCPANIIWTDFLSSAFLYFIFLFLYRAVLQLCHWFFYWRIEAILFQFHQFPSKWTIISCLPLLFGIIWVFFCYVSTVYMEIFYVTY